jgi:hypothetical protein
MKEAIVRGQSHVGDDGLFSFLEISPMLTTRLFICLGILTLTMPALGAQYFIVQDPGANQCTITAQLPAAGAGTVVGDGAYGDWDTANADMGAIAACGVASAAPVQWFIVQTPGTTQCTITGQLPAEGAGIAVGDGAYDYWPDADMRAMAACTGSGP